jgi:hypothetical protein
MQGIWYVWVIGYLGEFRDEATPRHPNTLYYPPAIMGMKKISALSGIVVRAKSGRDT